MDNIRTIMRRIERKYHLDSGKLKLDAVVISHWDHDHYFGVLNLMQEDLDDRAKDPTPPPQLQVSFLKYNKGTGDPESILYIPYPELDPAKYIYSTTTTEGEFGFVNVAGNRSRICKFLADMPTRVDELLKKIPKEFSASVGPPPLSLPVSQLIGRDLFTGQREPKVTPAQVESAHNPKGLVDAHGATMPGLYCVAANNRYLKGSKTSPKQNRGGSTPTNRSSIICMVIRKDGTVSHYLAGDSHQDLEWKVIDWTGLDPATSTSPKPTLKDRIALVKSSHHGSVTSTPITMCQTYKPMYFIFSSGNKHRHPSKPIWT